MVQTPVRGVTIFLRDAEPLQSTTKQLKHPYGSANSLPPTSPKSQATTCGTGTSDPTALDFRACSALKSSVDEFRLLSKFREHNENYRNHGYHMFRPATPRAVHGQSSTNSRLVFQHAFDSLYVSPAKDLVVTRSLSNTYQLDNPTLALR